MDEEGIIECLLANNITTVAQLVQLIECYENEERITDEERKILEFLKNKDILTLATLIENMRDEDIIFVNEEVLPDGEKLVPVSKKKVKAVVAQSDENKIALDIISTNEWCKKLLMQGINNRSGLNIDEPSCSFQVDNPIIDSQEKNDESSIVDVEDKQTKVQKNLEVSTETQPVKKTQVEQEEQLSVTDAAVGTVTTTDACNQTLESDFCGESAPVPSTSAQPDEATVTVRRKPSPRNNNNNYTYTSRDSMPQTVQRPASIRERKRSYISRDPRYRARRQEQIAAQNAALQPQTSQPSMSNVPVPPVPHAAQIPPPYSKPVPAHAHQMTRPTQPPPHMVHGNRRPNPRHTHGYSHNYLNYLQDPIGQNMVYGSDNVSGRHTAYGDQSNQSYSYYQHWPLHQNINCQHWHDPMITNQTLNNTMPNQTITCTTNYAMTHTGRNSRTNTTVASHTSPIMSWSAMGDTTNSAGQQHRQATLAEATAMQWTPQEVANLSGEHWQAHANAGTQYRASMSNTRGPHRQALMGANTVAGNNERQFPNASTDRVSPQLGTTMPEWLWLCRHWPQS